MGARTRRYSVTETYWIAYHAFRSMGHLIRSRVGGDLDPRFVERIMLAVTEVNGCGVCSYAHSRMALEAGMSNEEVRRILSGAMDGVPSDEVPAVLFAQHYAETRGNPTRGSWQRIQDTYGTSKAEGILGSIRTIMLGNAYGIAVGAFLNRLRGRPEDRSGLRYEVGMILGGVVIVPASFAHAVASVCRRVPSLTI